MTSAEVRLSTAERLLTLAPAGANWSRWICWVIRLALENALRELWLRQAPLLASAGMRAQLLALRVHIDATTARRAAGLWSSLSTCAHHHAYDLAPGPDDLRLWAAEAAVVISEIQAIRPE